MNAVMGTKTAAGLDLGRPTSASPQFSSHRRHCQWRRVKWLSQFHVKQRYKTALGAAADAFGKEQPRGSEPMEVPAYEQDYRPYERRKEGDPYRRLGLAKDASFEEVQDARNYLVEQYKWHEPSREAIELAFDDIMQEKLKDRHRLGFRPPKTGRRTDVLGEKRIGVVQRVVDLFDPTVTLRTVVNEGLVFGALALWSLFSSDQSFPLAAAFAYSVYQFQSKRIKRNPDGPFFGGNAIVGAILTTLVNLAVACALMAGVTAVLGPALGTATRQIGACVTVAVVGVMNIVLK